MSRASKTMSMVGSSRWNTRQASWQCIFRRFRSRGPLLWLLLPRLSRSGVVESAENLMGWRMEHEETQAWACTSPPLRIASEPLLRPKIHIFVSLNRPNKHKICKTVYQDHSEKPCGVGGLMLLHIG